MNVTTEPAKVSTRLQRVGRFAAWGALVGALFGMYTFFAAVHTGSPGELPGPVDVLHSARHSLTAGTGPRVFLIGILTLFAIVGAGLCAAIAAAVAWFAYEDGSHTAV